MSKQPDVYLELALRALERVPRFLADGRLIVAFRNVLAHGYATLDHRRVFDAATTKVATLSVAVRKLLEEFPTD